MKSLHNLLVGNNWVNPVDFWKMSPGQVWWVIESKTPKKSRSDDMMEIVAMVKAAKIKEAENG